MKKTVDIKSSKSGIVMVLDEKIEYEKLKEDIIEKLKSSSKFLKDAETVLGFEGRKLSDKEIKEILDIISDNTELNVVYVESEEKAKNAEYIKKIDENIKAIEEKKKKALEEEYKKKKEELIKEQEEKIADIKEKLKVQLTEEITEKLKKEEEERIANMPSMFYKGSLRSGQELEMETSVIIIGDVNPGATVSSKSNVVVLGTLFGNVHAGCDGNEDAFVIALAMKPNQIRIGSKIARSSDSGNANVKDRYDYMPQIAYVEEDAIYIETLNRAVVKELKV